MGHERLGKKQVCPRCGKAGLRLTGDNGEQGPAGIYWRFCRPCHEWVLPITEDQFDKKYGLAR